jgi:hypothetical protein
LEDSKTCTHSSFNLSRKDAEWEIKYRVSHRRTICEVFRELWDISAVLDNENARRDLQEKIIDGYIMGKKMNHRLCEYKETWGKGEFGPNTDFNEKMLLRNTLIRMERDRAKG